MKPQLQTRTGYPYGDCVRASYASLLELPIDKVPKFDPGSLSFGNQWEAERKWLRSKGLDLVIIPVIEGHQAFIPSDMFHMMSGPSPRNPDWSHRVVGRGGQLVWDPHPTHAGLDAVHYFHLVVPRQRRA